MVNLNVPISLDWHPISYPIIYCALVRENKIVQQVGRVDIAVQCMVVNTDRKRVKVKTDLDAPLIAMGALKCSKTSMMQVTEVSKGDST